MKKKSFKILIILLVAVLIVAAVVGVLLVLNSGHRVIKIEDYKGDVELERDGDEVDIFEGIKLKSEDEITTAQASEAELLCDDDKHILVRENTCFTIISKGNKKEGKLEIELLYGATLIDIEQKLPDDYDFVVSTPNASLSVRGTTFEVEYIPGENTTNLTVTDGAVKVKTKTGSMLVEKNQKAVIKDDEVALSTLEGQPVPVEPLPDGTSENQPTPEVLAFECAPSPSYKVSDLIMCMAGVNVRQLVGWDHVEVVENGILYNEFVNNGVHIRFTLDAPLSMFDEIYINADGYEIPVRTYLHSGADNKNKSFLFQKQIQIKNGDRVSPKYALNIVVYDEADTKRLDNSTAFEYINITLNKFFVFPNNVEIVDQMATQPDDQPSGPSEDIDSMDSLLPEILSGHNNKDGLIFILETCQTTLLNGSNFVETALKGIWYFESAENVYFPKEYQGDVRVYDLAQLDGVLALITDKSLAQMENLPEYIRVEGNNVYFSECTESEKPFASVTITQISYNPDQELEVKYDWEYTDGRSGNYVAMFYPDNNGVFRVGSIKAQ